MSDLRRRSEQLAADPELGPRVARELQATATWLQMVAMIHKTFAQQTINNFGSWLTGRDRNTKFVKWDELAMGGGARFTVRKPGTFNDVTVLVSVYAGGIAELEANVTVGRLPGQKVKRANNMTSMQLGKEMYELVDKLLAKV